MKESKDVTAATEKFEEPTTKEIREKLNAKIPREVISEREGGGARKLSYLEGWYVINRLNEIFGQGRWSYEVKEMRLVFAAEVAGKQVAHYVAHGSLGFSLPDGRQSYFTDFGYGDGSDKYNPGKAHELAVKEAATDGLKRCARNLGMSMGLALYDKKQENVDDGEPEEIKPAAKSAAPAKRETVSAPVEAAVGKSTPPEATREQVNSSISSKAKVLIAKKLMTKSDIRNEMVARYAQSEKEGLTDAQASEFAQFLQQSIDKGEVKNG